MKQPRLNLFKCHLCSSLIREDIYWFPRGNSLVATHYHCAAQHYDDGHVQMQFFDLEEYLDV